ncbi:MAG: trypsin-like serine protease [Myxococcota bacterium]|nr:trypsin-like serine protease [Myxococcota bacterium]
MRAARLTAVLLSLPTALVGLVGLGGLGACIGDGSDVETSVDQAEVLGGTNAPAGKWPDVVAVRSGSQQFCTGTLIAPTVAITAGHCNDGSLDNILIGTSSLARASEGEVISVIKKVEYENSFRAADLTVLVLAQPSRFTPRPIATGWARFDIKNGAQVALVGFGAIDRDGNKFVNELQEATTTITDADCTASAGCNASVKPGGELGAGGMGIDTCGGDSGGPLYLLTDYGTFLAGATSRGYDDNEFYCSEGGIYGRPDKFIDWIEASAGVPVARGPEPTGEVITAVRGFAGETSIVHNDPRSQSHSYTIKTPPMYGTAKVRDDGRVRVCTDGGVAGGDTMVVTVTDKADATRAVDVKLSILIEQGDPGSDCDVDAFGSDSDGGGCCDAGRSAGGALPLGLGVLAVVLRRRRRR